MNRRLTDEELERRLARALKSDCPPPLELGEYQMQLLPPERAAIVGAHVRTCAQCRSELEVLTEFLEDDQPSVLTEIKEIVLEWSRHLMQPRPGLVMAGVRGAATRAQTFTAAHLWLAVTVQEGENGLKNLLALVTREDGYPLEHGTAWLTQEDRLLMGGKIDPFGNLVITGLQPGEYDLGIQCDGTRVWIRGVSV